MIIECDVLIQYSDLSVLHRIVVNNFRVGQPGTGKCTLQLSHLIIIATLWRSDIIIAIVEKKDMKILTCKSNKLGSDYLLS